MPITPAGATIPEVTHHIAQVGTPVHYVTAGSSGSPVLLVHGFPESWWAFRGVIPLLAAEHRVIAVDLPGFGDSAHAATEFSSTFAAECLRRLIEHLDLGPVHLTGQDISGVTTFRLAATYPDLIRSFAAIETGLPGFGMEVLADVTHGGTWYIGVLAAPGIADMLMTGREREFLTEHAFPAMSASPDSITAQDLDEFTRVYAQPAGFAGASGLYRSMLVEGKQIQDMVAAAKLTMPVLSVGAGASRFTHDTMHAVATDVTEAALPDIRHLAALEDPQSLTETLLTFYRRLDQISSLRESRSATS
ncbi:alpha/beta fold hydrolase [Nocardia macrotermitis]|uniref:Soluble epoxide hydrolase n=1 Tax=Nocardia macrotermitis TaxID=2585198 RepID=A0A7K0D8P5_9NOCA|nr:alpha/beta hydrolase [Nocardia macrotermitis]MQY22136.1 Soluble epoxide hydrolase [Nocardia macrotermitis]